MNRFSTGVLTAVVAAMAAAAPALADKKSNAIRFAYDQVVENVDPFMNNVRIGVIIGQQVWDTLIYRDPEDRPNTRASSRPRGSGSTTRPSNSICARASSSTTARNSTPMMWCTR